MQSNIKLVTKHLTFLESTFQFLALWEHTKEVRAPCLQAVIGLAPLLLRASDAAAESPAGAPDSPSGVSIAEIVLLLAPILLYGGFSVYREKVNPRAKLSDFLFIAAGVVIVGNVLSILIFKVRLY